MAEAARPRRGQATWTESLDSTLCLLPEDLAILRTLLKLRLGRDGVLRTRFNTNTQHIEALHRWYSSCNHPQVTMSRNVLGRLHSAAHLHNHGIANSTIHKLKCLNAKLAPGARPMKALKRIERAWRQRLIWQKTPAARIKRKAIRIANYKMHAQKRFEITYKKDLLLRQTKATKIDHCYTRKRAHVDHDPSARTADVANSVIQ